MLFRDYKRRSGRAGGKWRTFEVGDAFVSWVLTRNHSFLDALRVPLLCVFRDQKLLPQSSQRNAANVAEKSDREPAAKLISIIADLQRMLRIDALNNGTGSGTPHKSAADRSSGSHQTSGCCLAARGGWPHSARQPRACSFRQTSFRAQDPRSCAQANTARDIARRAIHW